MPVMEAEAQRELLIDKKMPRTPDRLKKRGSREDLFSSFISLNHPSLLLLFNRHRLIAREVKGHPILYFFLPP